MVHLSKLANPGFRLTRAPRHHIIASDPADIIKIRLNLKAACLADMFRFQAHGDRHRSFHPTTKQMRPINASTRSLRLYSPVAMLVVTQNKADIPLTIRISGIGIHLIDGYDRF
jgi:hypothetical protein